MKKPLSSRMHRRAKRNKQARQELKGRAEKILKVRRKPVVVSEPEIWPPEDHVIHVNPDVSLYPGVPRNGCEERPFRYLKHAIKYAATMGWTYKVPNKKETDEYEKTGRIKIHLLRPEPKVDEGVYMDVTGGVP